MTDRKQVRNRMCQIQRRHLEQAVCAIKRREKGMEPNTIQFSARTIGIDMPYSQHRPCGTIGQTDNRGHLTE